MADENEHGYNQLGRRADFVAPKALSPSAIAKLGEALDDAEMAVSAAWRGNTGRYLLSPDTMPVEAYYELCDDFCRATVAYVRAVNARDRAAKVKLENARQVPTFSEGKVYRDRAASASIHAWNIEKAGDDFTMARDRIDAAAAYHLAECLLGIAERKYHDAQREGRRDKANGITRHKGASRHYSF